ncbi:MAG: DUF4928 family protein [Ktedonobacteraceae bacterium]
MLSQKELLLVFELWYTNQKKGNAPVPKGTIAGALVVLERLTHTYNLDLESHLTEGRGQIKGASGENIKRILTKFGEIRHFVSEGGRTNRGLLSAIDAMLAALATMDLAQFSVAERNSNLECFQQFLVEKVKEFHSRERLKCVYDPSISTWQTIANVLEIAKKDNKAGPVAQHLVGAKLKLRFPEEPIGRESYSTADKQLGRLRDFRVGTTAFHVTMAPMSAVYDKCARNISNGYRPYLLVPYSTLVGTRQIIEGSPEKGKVVAESIESFVSQNIEELANFSADRLAYGLFCLFTEYNNRIEETEADKSLSIEIPPNLVRLASKKL